MFKKVIPGCSSGFIPAREGQEVGQVPGDGGLIETTYTITRPHCRQQTAEMQSWQLDLEVYVVIFNTEGGLSGTLQLLLPGSADLHEVTEPEMFLL